MTHEQYLDEPGHTVDWLLQIHETSTEVDNERRKREELNASRR